MPRYRVVKPLHIGQRFHQPGEIVEYVGEPGQALEPMDDEAAAAKASAEATRPYETLPNGIQVRNKNSGATVVRRFEPSRR